MNISRAIFIAFKLTEKHGCRQEYWSNGSILLLAINPTEAKVCNKICYGAAAYMTCPSSGSTQLDPVCNCCLAPALGCTLYESDGTPICTST
ncbi:serine-type endopeptidase inhibitor [Prunus dulcis]|uniref:Serine-type endopeptidase inhibitor n=1 Tax=Prunus dulcis TaxID=3755 RepID=A0A4Y1QW03_PRUDU|nr:serine-type endopeptidase inhibitor [Prunus dulcis]